MIGPHQENALSKSKGSDEGQYCRCLSVQVTLFRQQVKPELRARLEGLLLWCGIDSVVRLANKGQRIYKELILSISGNARNCIPTVQVVLHMQLK